jgi:extradiol dioxygenase family protein
MRPFHLAFPVTDIEATRSFYGGVMGCRIGRESPGCWIDFDLFGHQLSAHLRPAAPEAPASGGVDGDQVPIPHFGVVLEMADWKALAARLEADPDTDWRLRPKIRFEGEPGEQATMFVMDPSGNALEFKAFADDAAIFAA